MSIYRRGKIYYMRFQFQGREINRSCGTTSKEEAEQCEAETKRDLWREAKLGEKPDRIWQEAVSSWIKANQDKRSLDDDLEKLTWLKDHFNDKRLSAIDIDLIESTLDLKDISNARRNRYYSVIRGVLKRAHYLGWLSAVPPIKDLEEVKKTPRFLSREEVATLLEKLDAPRRLHTRDMVRLSLATGLRESNVTGLKWSQVDIDRRFAYVPLENAKSKRTLRVRLNSEAMAVLESRAGKHKTHVFSYRGKPVAKANRDGYREALKDAGLSDCNWHTLRHTWASWHVMSGTPLEVLRELGGWATLDVVMVYAHLAPSYRDDFAENSVQMLLHPKSQEVEKATATA